MLRKQMLILEAELSRKEDTAEIAASISRLTLRHSPLMCSCGVVIWVSNIAKIDFENFEIGFVKRVEYSSALILLSLLLSNSLSIVLISLLMVMVNFPSI